MTDYREHVNVLVPDPENVPVVIGGTAAYIVASCVVAPSLGAVLEISSFDAFSLFMGAGLMGALAYITSIRPRVVDM
jgi:hypothetical protein